MANFTSKKILLFGPVFNQAVACTTGVIFFAVLQAREGKREVSMKRQTSATRKTQKKTTPCPRTIVLLDSAPDIPLKGTVTGFCACAASWFLVWRTFFQDWLLVKKSSVDSETPEKATISVSKTYLIHFGSFKRHILYFCASIVEKIQSYWGVVHEAIFFVVSIPTNGSNVAFNVVLWLSFLSVKFSSQRSTFSGEFLNVKYVKKVEKGFHDTAMDYKWDEHVRSTKRFSFIWDN